MLKYKQNAKNRTCYGAALTVVLTAALCTAAGAQERGDTLTMAGSTAVTTLNPSELSTTNTWNWLIALGYDSLLWYEADGSFTAGLATEWGFNEGNTEFSMTLRPDVKFQDGTPLDAEAAAASLDYAFGNAASRARLYAPSYKDAEATGPLSLVVKCDPACPALPWLLTQAVEMGSIVSPAGLADPTQLGTAMFGSGPYILNQEKTVSGDSYYFDANPDYWNPETIHYDHVVLRVIVDENARLSALQTGQVDLIDAISPQQAGTVSGDNVIFRGTFSATGLTVHDIVGSATEGDAEGRTYSQPLADQRVRQALNYAVDRQALSDALGQGFASPTSVRFFDTDLVDQAMVDYYNYDPEKAKALLADAGYADGFTLDVTVGAFNPGVEDWAQAVASYWQEIGVTVNLNATRTIPIWVQEAQLAPAIYAGTGGSSPFVSGLYYAFVQGTTYSQWHPDAELVRMVEEQASAGPEDQAEIHKAMLNRAIEQGYWVTVAKIPGIFAYNAKKLNLNMEQDQFAGIPISTRITPIAQ